jgi:hypothetical protein
MSSIAPFFDRLCGIVERHIPELDPLMRSAKLFVFDKKPSEIISPILDAETIATMNDNFFLPFPVVAIEDSASVVLLEDVDGDACGIGSMRFFMEYMDSHGSGFAEDGERSDGEFVRIQTGFISMRAFMGAVAGQFQIQFCLNRYLVFRSDPKTSNPTTDLRGNDCVAIDFDLFSRLSQSPKVALEEMLIANTPSRFVLESAPRKIRDPLKSPKIPRSQDRPHYTLLTPGEIRRRFIRPDSPAPSHKMEMGHERRRHFRTLHSEKFTRKRGQTILIPATWVGPHESKIGNRTYKVMLDL